MSRSAAEGAPARREGEAPLGSLPERPLRALLMTALAGLSFISLAASVKGIGQAAGIAPPIFARGIVGSSVCGVWALARGISLRPRGRWRLLLRCTAGGAAMSCYYASIGLLGTELGTASMLLKTSPLWVALLAPAFVRERPSSRVWGALAVGLAGVVLAHWGIPASERLGIALCLLAGVLSAVAYLSLRGLAHSDDPVTVVFVFSVFLAVGALPFLAPFAARAAGEGWPAHVWGLLVLAGLCGTCGQLFLTAAYRWATAAVVTVAGLMEVGLAMAISFVVFAQTPSPAAALGGLLAMGGGILATAGRERPAGSAGTAGEPAWNEGR